MSDNSDAAIPAQRGTGNVPEYTVSELSSAVKRTIEGSFGWVRVRGEISRPSVPASGHCYLRLKDDAAVLDAVIWRGVLARLGIRPEEGLEVIVTGRMTTYPGKSTYQLVIERMELAGEGALLKMIEERRKRLAAEGLFDEARKKKIPFLPDVIGVITSPTGAVIRDILHRLAERFPRRVLIWPVAVQGEGAADQVAAAIDGFNALPRAGKVPRPDLLIVARGGGSLEDLMPFNEEIVVRAAAASAIPLISAVGHETDTTLIDYAADLRAPTPTAAAERAVPVRADLIADVSRDGARLVAGLTRLVSERRTQVAGLARGLGDPRRLVEECRQRLDVSGERLSLGLGNWLKARRASIEMLGRTLPHPRERLARAREAAAGLAARLAATAQAQRHGVARGRERGAELIARLQAAAARSVVERRQRLAAVAGLLESVAPTKVLERGYVLVRDAAGHVLTGAGAAQAAVHLALQFHDGTVGATVTGAAAPPPSTPATPKRPAKRDGTSQGSLL
ncbi:MAG: exodeoxyribonuclease VII large subunit [Alphaproteobacteria bacterium]|nr:exodeoxyribonuclease VII large subunit [Alphaproteobacteria bacterium]